MKTILAFLLGITLTALFFTHSKTSDSDDNDDESYPLPTYTHDYQDSLSTAFTLKAIEECKKNK